MSNRQIRCFFPLIMIVGCSAPPETSEVAPTLRDCDAILVASSHDAQDQALAAIANGDRRFLALSTNGLVFPFLQSLPSYDITELEKEEYRIFAELEDFVDGSDCLESSIKVVDFLEEYNRTIFKSHTQEFRVI